MKRRVLIIEDDAAIRRGLVDVLDASGYATAEAGDAAGGLDLALSIDCELILLDLVLPGGDGLCILREVRNARPSLPVIILTARSEEADRIRGLKLGADDYVVKPFSVAELLARVEAVLRRSADRPRSDLRELAFEGGSVNFLRREITHHDGGRCELTSASGSCCGISRSTPAGPSHATKSSAASGGSIRRTSTRGP